MTATTSVYLDLLRIGAALIVYLFHLWRVVFPGQIVRWPGSDAVILFFVISGFVISSSVDLNPMSLSRYGIRRLTRLWSVVAPALVFAAILTIFVRRTSLWATSSAGQRIQFWSSYAVSSSSVNNFFFVSQVWFRQMDPPFNAPFWSLNYEAWFYAIFGAWYYLPTLKGKWASFTLATLAGPKILLLFPCWVLGAWVARRQAKISEGSAYLLFWGSISIYALYFYFDVGGILQTYLSYLWPRETIVLGHSAGFVGLCFDHCVRVESDGRQKPGISLVKLFTTKASMPLGSTIHFIRLLIPHSDHDTAMEVF